MKPIALTVAGSDPSGGAGIQADLKTFHQVSVYGMSVITLVTVQNTQCVSVVEPLPAELVGKQLDALIEDIPPHAAKTGALGTAEIIEEIAEHAQKFSFPLVVDPVMLSKDETELMVPSARKIFIKRLLPQAFLITPNLDEAAILAGIAVNDELSMQESARRIADLGPRAVLVKGGHLEGKALDLLFHQGKFQRFIAHRETTAHMHGTGCTHSAAITAGLAHGKNLEAAVRSAKQFISRAIIENPGLGHGIGPVNHHAKIK